MGRATASFLAAGWLALAALGRAEMPDFSKTKPPPGRTFKTNQDKVNYALCQAGHKNTCAHVHYNEGPLPKKAASPAGGPPAKTRRFLVVKPRRSRFTTRCIVKGYSLSYWGIP